MVIAILSNIPVSILSGCLSRVLVKVLQEILEKQSFKVSASEWNAKSFMFNVFYVLQMYSLLF